jgi:hypothetical protein
MIINDITNGIKSTVQNTLGSEYSEMPYGLDVAKNNFNNNHNRYAVIPGASTETDSVTKFVTMSQSFEVVLSKAYIDDGISDAEKQQTAIDAKDLVFNIYKSLVNTKAGTPLQVINVTDLSIDSSEFIDEQKVVIIRASFNVLHRFTLI